MGGCSLPQAQLLHLTSLSDLPAAVGSEDISLRTISVVQQSDASRTIGIVLDALDRSRDTVLISLEVDETKLLLVTTTDVAHSHLTGVVTTTGLLLTYDKGLLWCAGSDVIERTNNLIVFAPALWA